GRRRRPARKGGGVMDCTSARLLLKFARTGEIDPSERNILDSHVAGCPDCAAHARSEERFDDALALAMTRVAMPAGLKGRIVGRRAQARRPRPWPWVAAAALFVAVAGGGIALWKVTHTPADLDFESVQDRADVKQTPEAVEAYFSKEFGIPMAAPRDFNF